MLDVPGTSQYGKELTDSGGVPKALLFTGLFQ